MKNMIEKIKTIFQKHKKVIIIAAAVLLVLIILMILLLSRGCSNTSEQQTAEKETKVSEYFQNTDYPVRVSYVDKDIRITLGGNKLAEQDWLVDTSNNGVITMIKEDERADGACSVLVTPESVGYTTITFRQTSSVGGLDYDIVRIDADIMVYSRDEISVVSYSYSDPNANVNDMNKQIEILYTDVKDIRLNTSASGAVDSDTPYLLQKDKVILPNGGDWTLTPFEQEKLPEGLYVIRYITTDEKIGCPYYKVKKDTEKLITEDGMLNEDAMDSCLLLKSESLGIEKKLECTMDSERVWILSEKEENASESEAAS